MNFNEKALIRATGVACTNSVLAVWFGLFAYAHAVSFIERPRLSIFLMVVMETTAAFFLLIRRAPDETWHSWRTWITTSGGTLAPLLLRPTAAVDDLLVGQFLQTSACALQIAAVLSLNRSFGLLPAYRGVRSNGLYRWVRHPLYSAYTMAIAGYLINNFTAYN
ncbi:MAG: isoprenylcysteine carboxyl methyltransferase, partial [Burkholderiales bacterium]|nr:isoprenylcysteine carboxyl methyltransferase [Burkholderiales bacterium]